MMGALPTTLRVLERGWLSSNSVLFDDGDAVAIVDTGYASHAAQTVALVDATRNGKPLTRIVNTHLHSDHVGGNAALQRRHAVQTWIPRGEADVVRAWDETRLSYAATGQQCPRFTFDHVLADGDRVRLGGLDWDVHAVPGHDPQMVMLFARVPRVLISADALWENGFGAIFPEVEGAAGFEDQRASLDRIEQLAPALVIPGHGAPFADLAGALARARARLAALAASPPRNARHVFKVLLKFWLLQVRQAAVTDAVAHFAPTRYAAEIHARYFSDLSFETMVERALDELISAGAARREGPKVLDVDAK